MRHPLVRRLVDVAFAVLLLAALGYAVTSQRAALGHDLRRLDAVTLLGALGAFLVGLVLSMLSWRAVLVDLGSPLPVPTAARIFFVGQLGKYLPGSVWPLLMQTRMGGQAGVPRTRMATTGLVALALSVATGLASGLLCLPALLGADQQRYAVAAVVLLALALVGLHPAVLNRILDKGLRLARRPPLEHRLSGRGIAVSSAYLFGCWAAFGTQAYLLARGVGLEPGSGRALPLAVGAFALAATLGLLFVVAPAGAGVREAVLIGGLAPVLSASGATTVALVSRLVSSVADGLVAGAALLADKRGGTGQ